MLTFRDKIIHHGGASGVTGSCHEWQFSEQNSILVDCGLFQGNDSNGQDLNFHSDDVKRFKALVVTHCHIDHVGRLPWLIAAGYRGPIICTVPTAQLLPLVLEDALQIQIPGQDQLVLNTLKRIQKQLIPLEYDQPFELFEESDRVTVTLQNAGHILGSAYVEVEHNHKVTVFSGDLGAAGAMLNTAPQSPKKADRLILESTYGDRVHESRADRVERFKQILIRSLKDGGPIIIPAFSLGRTQELLATIDQIKTEAGLTHDIQEPWEGQQLPVILDSPLASRLTFAYRRLRPYWSDFVSGKNPFTFDSLATTQNHREHLAVLNHLKSTGKPAIIIAASGMCQGGRVVNYLKEFLPKKNTDVVFVGYQADGTLGKQIIEGNRGDWVDIYQKKIQQNAKIHTLNGFSAHADQNELIEFVDNIPEPPSEIRLVHGNRQSRNILLRQLKSRYSNTAFFTEN